jgi:mono/diheme cytochrome c family protein
MRRSTLLLGLVAAGLCTAGVCSVFNKPFRRGTAPPVEATVPETVDTRWYPNPVAPKPQFATDVSPILAKHCLPCHDANTARGALNLSALSETDPVWEKVATAVRGGSMPPAGRARLTHVELETLDAWFDAAAGSPDAAHTDRVSVRRLNRAEYNNTIRDLIGLDLRPADEFPADDSGHGFDNNADVLALPPLLLEKYIAAAERVVEAAFRNPASRHRLMNPPPDPVPLALRQITLPERDHVRNRLVLSKDDLPPPDPLEEERQRAYPVLMAFADRAYRRPATHAEVNRLLRFVEDAVRSGDGAEHGLRVAFQAILCSPSFLFRIESRAAGRVTDIELAVRLSYFLWSSCPDEELFAHAVRGTLRQGNNLVRQVQRLLADPKSQALAENFAGQWLRTRGLRDHQPDPALFPDFDDALRSAMLRETELFFDAVVREDRSVLDFLAADFTFVNERLARHYGLGEVRGPEFRKVSLVGTPRRGVLTHASVLTVTSNPTRTSPVKRGRWVLDNILGTPPPGPPPGVEQLTEPNAAAGTTLRQRMERHRTNANCAACHATMDPLGFGLEAFDAIGAERMTDGGHPVDDSGVLPDGRGFRGANGLRAVLLGRCEAFARCFAEKCLTYALGRGLERCDRRALTDIARKLIGNDYRFSALVLAVAHSDPFQTRTGHGATR